MYGHLTGRPMVRPARSIPRWLALAGLVLADFMVLVGLFALCASLLALFVGAFGG